MDTFVLVRNIPKSLHSKDLRDFFSEHVETEKFTCFHFLHRKESDFVSKFKVSPPVNENTCCCVVKLPTQHCDDFLRKYQKKQWAIGMPRCFIQRLANNDLSKSVLSDLQALQELHPPPVMPNGNVGTPTAIFLDEIRQCKLPTSLIGKLGLRFPKATGRKYANVPFKYENLASNDDSESEDVDNEDADSCEEFERHEATTDDPSNQERLAERLFEEPLEVIWDKGSSGLVFYTDAQLWDELAGDFDDKTADDLDVDMSVYYEGWESGDMDAKQRIEMAESDRLYAGVYKRQRDSCPPNSRPKGPPRQRSRSPLSSDQQQKVGGFGKQVLEACGWKIGQGLGRNSQGIKDPIEADGQNPRERIGFGYRGSKINLQAAVQAARQAAEARRPRHLIATIYDKTDKDPGLYRRNDHNEIRHNSDPSLPSTSAATGTPGMSSTDYR